MLSSELLVNRNHWSQITKTNTIIIKRFKALWQVPKCDTRHKGTKCCQKHGCDRPAWHRVITNLQFVKNAGSVKHNQVKCNKTRSAYLSVFDSVSCFKPPPFRLIIAPTILLLFLFKSCLLSNDTYWWPLASLVVKNSLCISKNVSKQRVW